MTLSTPELGMLLAALGVLALGWRWQSTLGRRGVHGGILWWLPAGLVTGVLAILLLALTIQGTVSDLRLWGAETRGWQWAWFTSYAHRKQALVLGVGALLLAPLALRSRGVDRALGAIWSLVAALGAGVCGVASSRVIWLTASWGPPHPSVSRVIARLEDTTATLDVLVPLLVVGLVAALGGSLVALWRAPGTLRGRWERRIGLGLLVGTLVGQGSMTAWGVALDTLCMRPDLDEAMQTTGLPIADEAFGDAALTSPRVVRGADGAVFAPPLWRLEGLRLSPTLSRSIDWLDEGVTLRPADTPVAPLLDRSMLQVVTLPAEASTDPAARRWAAARAHEVLVAPSVENLEVNLMVLEALGMAKEPALVEATGARPADVNNRCVWLLVDPVWTLQDLIDARVSLEAAGARDVIAVPPALAPAARALMEERR
ncbi:MAG: hypothetical protein H6739_41775 [Alphaproteobacteria bacterium]|nr:hypothetical protein [Alphaproteobacteria bacterium]